MPTTASPGTVHERRPIRPRRADWPTRTSDAAGDRQPAPGRHRPARRARAMKRRRTRRRPTPITSRSARAGHPIRHVFTRAIPTSQCMTCHMHQPNIFLNTYLGYTMWDYESDADLMWPGPENRLPARNAEEERRFRNQHYPTAAEVHAVLDRNSGGRRSAWPVGRSSLPARGLRSGEPARPPHPVRRLSRPWLELPGNVPGQPGQRLC